MIKVEDDSLVEKTSNAWEETINLIPKRYQTKAKALIHYLKDRVTLDANERIKYDDGSVGSHIYDMIRFYVYPAALSLKRPLDAVQFGLMLKEIGVPDAAVSRNIVIPQSAQLKHGETGKKKRKAVNRWKKM